MRAPLTPFVLLAATACAGPRAAGPGADPAAAARALLDAQYRAVEAGDLTTWAEAFAEDALLFGTDAGEVQLGKQAILRTVAEGAARRMRPEVRRTYTSGGGFKVGVAPSGRAAWVADDIVYTVTSSAGTARHLFRMTGLVAEAEGRWHLLAASYSVPVPDAEAFSRSWPTPAPLPDAVGPGAEPLAALAAGISARPMHFAGAFSDRPDVLLWGTAPGEEVEGGEEAQRFTREDDDTGALRVAVRGGVAAGLSPDGTAGWLAYQGTLTLPAGQLPVRVLAVFLREEAGWRKVQEHVSVPQ